MLKHIDAKKNQALRLEKRDKEQSYVNYSTLTNFATLMDTIHDSFLETFYKATEEYYAFQETKEMKRKPKAFLHILLDLFSITLNFLGIGEEADIHQYQKGAIQVTRPSNWQDSYTRSREETEERIEGEQKQDREERLREMNIEIEEFEKQSSQDSNIDIDKMVEDIPDD